jgi:hypothetical protein
MAEIIADVARQDNAKNERPPLVLVLNCSGSIGELK